MTDLEKHIERALQAEAANYDPPADLAERTLQAAQALPEPGLAEKMRARRVARWTSERSAGYPNWAYAGAAAVLLVAFYAVGRVATPDVPPQTVVYGPPGVAVDQTASGAAGAGQAVPERRAAVTDRDAVGGSVGALKPGADMSAPEPYVAPAPGIVPPQSNPGVPPKIIRSVDAELRVRRGRFETVFNRAQQIAAAHGGFVTQSSTEMVRDKIARGYVTMRVPADQLDAALREIRALGTVARLNTSGTDVAGQLVDFEARLRALRAQEAQLLELLKQARSVSEILEVRSRLDAVRQEIEQLDSQKQFLQNQVDLATLSLTIYEPDGAPDFPRPAPRIERAWRQGVEAATMVVAGVIVVAGYLAPLAILAALAWLGVRMARRRRAA